MTSSTEQVSEFELHIAGIPRFDEETVDKCLNLFFGPTLVSKISKREMILSKSGKPVKLVVYFPDIKYWLEAVELGSVQFEEIHTIRAISNDDTSYENCVYGVFLVTGNSEGYLISSLYSLWASNVEAFDFVKRTIGRQKNFPGATNIPLLKEKNYYIGSRSDIEGFGYGNAGYVIERLTIN